MYQYREKFGLSQKEIDDEPLEVYLINAEIMSAINQIDRESYKKHGNK